MLGCLKKGTDRKNRAFETHNPTFDKECRCRVIAGTLRAFNAAAALGTKQELSWTFRVDAATKRGSNTVMITTVILLTILITNN